MPGNIELPRELTRYLRALEVSLFDAPPKARTEILADVRAHATDALAEGRTVDDVLASFGPVHEHAAQHRAELGLPDTPPLDARRSQGTLSGAALVIAVLTGSLVAFVFPTAPAMVRNFATYTPEVPNTVVATYGLGAALIAFLPAVLALLPFVFPASLRTPVGVANAATVTLLTILTFGAVGKYYVPVALLMCAAVLIPWRISGTVDRSVAIFWRIAGGVFIAIPGLLYIETLIGLQGSFNWVGAVVVGVVLVFAVLFALGSRVTYYLVAATGLALMLLFAFGGEPLIPFWWAGGVYLMVGLSAIATLHARVRNSA